MTQSITFELPTDIAYVAGTVNDVETVFVQDEAYPIRWRATVDADPDNLYRIYLEMYDEAGNKSEYNNTIEYILPQFVYDRTAEDVARVKELRMIGWQNLSDEQKQEWLGGLKGAFNLSDVKRNENNCFVLAQLLNVSLVTYRDNLPKHPDREYFENLRKNVQALRDVGYRFIETPEVPPQPINTYQKVNDLEKILHDVYEVYNSNFTYYAGEGLCAGDDTNLLL
jgi:hypothetical protein